MLLRYLRCRALAALVGVLAAVIWTCAGGAATASGTATSFSGQACALKAQVLNLDEIDLGCATLPSTGGAENSSLLSVSNLALPGGITVNNAEVFGGHTVGQGNESHAHSSVANVNVSFAGQNVGAEFLMSKASAKCGFQPTGTSELVGLTINNQSYVVGTQPNQQLVNAAGVTITANKQTSTADTIDVAALEIAVQGVGTVDIATTHADIHCPSPPGPPSCPVGRDFITGGGWFTMITADKRHFADAAGYKNNGIWGHLVYMDKAAGVKVEGDPVWYGPVGIAPPALFNGSQQLSPFDLIRSVLGGLPSADPAATRYIVGMLKGGGAYLVRTLDGGEPGHGVDQFDIVFLHVDTDVLGKPTGSFSTFQGAYAAASDLTPGIGGGNVQLHKPCG